MIGEREGERRGAPRLIARIVLYFLEFLVDYSAERFGADLVIGEIKTVLVGGSLFLVGSQTHETASGTQNARR